MWQTYKLTWVRLIRHHYISVLIMLLTVILCWPALTARINNRTGTEAVIRYEQRSADNSQALDRIAAGKYHQAPDEPSRLQRIHENDLLDAILSTMRYGHRDRLLTYQKLHYETYLLREIKQGQAGQTAPDLLTQRLHVATLTHLLRTHTQEVEPDTQFPPALTTIATALQSPSTQMLLMTVIVLWAAISVLDDERANLRNFGQMLPMSVISRRTSKIAATMTAFIAVLLSSLLFAIVGIWLFNGLGDWHYPLAYSPHGTVILFTATGRFIVQSIALIIVNFAWLLMLAALVNTIWRQVLVNIVAVMIPLISSGTQIKWLPSTFLNVKEILLPINSTHDYSTEFSLLIPVVWSALLFVILLVISQCDDNNWRLS